MWARVILRTGYTVEYLERLQEDYPMLADELFTAAHEPEIVVVREPVILHQPVIVKAI